MKKQHIVTVTLDKIVGGGQALGTLENGKKLFAWGGLPGETVDVLVTKKKSSLLQGVVTHIHNPSSDRIDAVDADSYLSTSPWQIMTFSAEQHYKAALIEEAFELHDIVLPSAISVHSNDQQYQYRNKIEFSFWHDTDTDSLSLAFFRRGTHGKIPITKTSLASPAITALSQKILAVLNDHNVQGRSLKTLLIRSNQQGEATWQLYVKDEAFAADIIARSLQQEGITNGEIIFSNPKSPASVITKKLATLGNTTLTDTLRGVSFRYATEGFFQINLPVYEQALSDIKQWVEPQKPLLDLYSGVGTIGLTIADDQPVTLVEVNEHAVREMQQNIIELQKAQANAVLAASENALDYITNRACIIVDPPRAGLHQAVIETLLAEAPERIIYLSCNPTTQARDVALLAEKYGIRHHSGYNFFPRTPHIEHLVVLDKRM